MSGLFQVPLLSDEPLTSLVSRLARANGASTSRRFCLQIGLNFSKLNRGDHHEVGRLAEVAGYTRGDLMAAAIIVDDDRGATIGDSYFSKLMLRRSRLRFCPHCVLDDDNDDRLLPGARRHARTYWMFPHISTCLTHSRRLVEREDTRFDRHRYDFITQLDIVQDQMRDFISENTLSAVLAFERYVHDRISNIKGHGGFLDSINLAAGIVACELLGVAEIYGHKANTRSKSDEELAQARDAGFRSLSKGIEGFCETLDRIMSDAPRRSTRGGQTLYGGLYSALDQTYEHPQYDVLRQAIRRHTLHKVPMLNGATFFGPVTDSPWTSVTSIVRATGHSDQTVRRLLVELGHLETLRMPKDAIFIKTDIVDQAINYFKNTATLEEASVMLGLTPSVVRKLIDAGFLSAARSVEAAASKTYKMNDRYSREDVLELLARVLDDFGDTADPAWLPLGSVAKRCNVRVVDVLQLLIDRRLKKVGKTADSEGIGSLRFDWQEVDALQPGAATSLLGRLDVCRRLKIGSDTFALLVREGYLQSRQVRLRAGRAVSYMVTENAIEDFDKQFASFSRLTAETGITGKSLGVRLRREGVALAFDGQTRDRIVARSSLPDWVLHAYRDASHFEQVRS